MMDKILAITSLAMCLMACSSTATVASNDTQGREVFGAAGGATVGAVAGALIDSTTLYPAIGLGVVGAAAGHYLTSLEPNVKAIQAAGGDVHQLGGFVSIILPVDTIYEINTTDFIPGAEPLLQNVLVIINDFKDDVVVVEGHTDRVGSQLHQAEVSRAQAVKVAHYFEAKLPGLDLRYEGYADTAPIADVYSAKGMAMNRRIQINIFPKKA